jgi:hypothetical protein
MLAGMTMSAVPVSAPMTSNPNAEKTIIMGHVKSQVMYSLIPGTTWKEMKRRPMRINIRPDAMAFLLG